jgi:ADP-ribose pyrophosphatase YjhB (NUDIX family)
MCSLQQIYAYYEQNLEQTIDDYQFCPNCGTELLLKESGGRERPSCSACGFIHFRNPAPAVCVVIIDGDRILLGKRAAPPGEGKWAIPSGYIEFEDDYVSTAIQEAKEETGLDVEVHAVFNVLSSFYSPKYHFLVIYVIAHMIGGEMQAGDDMVEVDWFSLLEPLPELAFIEDKDALKVLVTGNFKLLPISGDQVTQKSRS